jgi:hypothetical protein
MRYPGHLQRAASSVVSRRRRSEEPIINGRISSNPGSVEVQLFARDQPGVDAKRYHMLKEANMLVDIEEVIYLQSQQVGYSQSGVNPNGEQQQVTNTTFTSQLVLIWASFLRSRMGSIKFIDWVDITTSNQEYVY